MAILQRQVDELDDLKAQHYQNIVEHEEEVWDVVQGKVCVVVRSTLDVFDRFTSKAYVDCLLSIVLADDHAVRVGRTQLLSPCFKSFLTHSTPTVLHRRKTRYSPFFPLYPSSRMHPHQVQAL